jgi:hypothetical protein
LFSKLELVVLLESQNHEDWSGYILTVCLLHLVALVVVEINRLLLVVSQIDGPLAARGLVLFLKSILYYGNDSSSYTEAGRVEESDAGLTRIA